MKVSAEGRLLEREAQWSARLQGAWGHPLYIYREQDSGLDRLAELAATGAPEGSCVVTELQRAGRGRQGRRWVSAPGQSLLVALLLRPRLTPAEGGLLSLAAAVALVRAAGAEGVALQVKWPNDVIHGERKVAGILLESRLSGGRFAHVALGMGVNVHQGLQDFPAELRARAGSLDLIAGRRLDRSRLLAAWLHALEALLADLHETGAASLLAAWRGAWPHRGRRARDERGEEMILRDVVERGELVADGERGPRRLSAGDHLLL